MGATNKIVSMVNNDSMLVESFIYTGDGRIKQYSKRQFLSLPYPCSPLPFTSNSQPQWDWRYRYTPLGGREQKRLLYSPSGDSACENNIFYHPWTYYLLGAGGEQLAVYKGVQVASADTSNHTGRRVYMYPHSFISAGGSLVTLADSTKQFNISDNLGSCRSTISVKNYQVSVAGYDYKPFGDTLNADGENKIGFTGQERDEESRFIVMGVRQYDPKTGRFLSIDPFFEKFPSQSPYQYAYNNPISFKDPTGFEPESEKGGEDRMQWAVIKDDLKFSAMILDQARQLMNQDGNLDTGPGSYTGWELSWNQIQNYFLKQYGGSGGGGLPLTNDVASKADGMTTYGYWDIIESREQWKLEHPEVVDPDDGVRTGTYIYTSPNGTKTIVNYRYKSSQNENYIKKMITGGLDYMAVAPVGANALDIYSQDCSINVDLTMTGKELARLYDKCGKDYKFLGGISSNFWLDNDTDPKSASCDLGLEKGWIYIASNYIDDPNYSFRNDYYRYEITNGSGKTDFKNYNFAMTFSHEFKHTFDAMFGGPGVSRDPSSIEFTKSIWEFHNPGLYYKHWKR